MICAGTFQSPQLLELSGIGDPMVLKEARIPCVVPNPDVGNNLQEHTMSAAVYELADGIVSFDSIFPRSRAVERASKSKRGKVLWGDVWVRESHGLHLILFTSQQAGTRRDDFHVIYSVPYRRKITTSKPLPLDQIARSNRRTHAWPRFRGHPDCRYARQFRYRERFLGPHQIDGWCSCWL